jgi:PAS domain S-box-containing protein
VVASEPHEDPIAAWRLSGVPIGAVGPLLSKGQVGIVIVGPDLVVRWAHQPEPPVYEAPDGELVGNPIADLGRSGARAAALLRRVFETGAVVEPEPDGHNAAHDGDDAEHFVPVRAQDDDTIVGAAHVWATEPGVAWERFRLVERALTDSQDALRLVLRAGSMGTWSWDRVADRIEWDDMMCELFGVSHGPRSFEAWLEMMHPDDRQEIRRVVDEGVATAQSFRVVRRIVRPDGAVRYFEGRADPTLDDQGNTVFLRGVTIDVTQREEALVRAERLAAHSQLLADAGAVLSATLDPEGVLRRLTELVVPALADGCEVALLEPDGRLRRLVHVAGIDEGRIRRREDTTVTINDDHPLANVIRTGKSMRLTATSDEGEAGLGPADVDTTAASFGIDDAAVVPLTVRGRIVGALALGLGPSRRSFGPEVLDLAGQLGARAALSYENARLFSQKREIADTLQRHLLPAALPDVDWLDLASRYWVPGAAIDVGGDFYDVFEDNGGVVAIVGDVCGKGIEAASLTALARHTLRAALAHGLAPVEALTWLHDAMCAQNPDSFVTVAVTRLTRNDNGSIDGEAAIGGHPRPLIVRGGGTTEIIEGSGAAPGLPYWQPATAVRFALQPDDTLVLYTDGVTDVPGDAALTTDELLAATAAFAGDKAEEFAGAFGDMLERRRPLHQRTDDIALVVARAIALPPNSRQ